MIKYNKLIRFDPISEGYKNNQVGFMVWKENPCGVVFVPASDCDRKEFGPGVFRIAKDEMHYEFICRIDPKKRRLYFVDNERYLEGALTWQDYILLTRLIIKDKPMFEAAYKEQTT